MSEGAKLWCFILLIPFFLALGHDLYANYYLNQDKKTRLEAFEIDPKAYQSSDMGYLLVKYMPETFEVTRNAIGEEQWTKWIDPLLRLYTFVVALVPAILFFIWLLISRLLDILLFASSPARSSRINESQPGKYRESDQMKYKRN